ncbi:MAG: hypothetical protein ACRD1H_20905, partial [Vicinamibacterales bacterium]
MTYSSSPGEPTSSQVTVAGTANSASTPAVSSAIATTVAGPASQASGPPIAGVRTLITGRRISPRLFLRLHSLFDQASPADCIRRAAAGAALLVLFLTAAGAIGGQAPRTDLALVNHQRADIELPPLVQDSSLDALAARYVAEVLARRCLCPPPAGASADETLLRDVSATLGSESQTLDAALIVAYDLTPTAAVTTATLDPAHAAAVLSPRLTLAGIATGQV